MRKLGQPGRILSQFQFARRDLVQFSRRNLLRAKWVRGHSLRYLCLLLFPSGFERRAGEVRIQKQFHVRRLGGLKRRDQHGAEESFDVEMARHAENSNWSLRSARCDLGHVTRGAIDPDCRESAEMFDLVLAAEPD